MAELNSDNARIYGGDDDAFYVGPVGTLLPTDFTAPSANFTDLGWLHEDGITETPTGSKTEKRGHQGAKVVRTIMETPGTTVSFHALESKDETRRLRYDVKNVTEVTGIRRELRSPGQRVSVRSAVIDLFDRGNSGLRERYIIPRLEIVPDGERVFGGTEISGYPFLGEIIGDYTVITSVIGDDEPED